MQGPVWIEADVVLAIHKRQLAEHGGRLGVRDEGMLASALHRPRNQLVYSEGPPDIADLAASYAFGIAKNHPFFDGNKRTAAVVCETFLALNGYELSATDEEMYQAFVGLAEGRLSETGLADWIRRWFEKLG